MFRVETPTGVLPYEFRTQREAKDYAIASLSWTGTRFRIIRHTNQKGTN